MSLESTTFFNVIEKHELVSEKQLATLKAAIKKETVSQADLESMVAKNFFTKWQAQRLLSGKHNFSVGDFRLVDFLGKDELGEVYLVRPKGSKKQNRLKLLSKELCADQAKLDTYLQRVHSFQSIQNPRIPKVLHVAPVGGRSIVVSEIPAGRPLVERLSGKSQSDALVNKVVEKVAKTIAELEMADLSHGTINGHSIHITDQQKLALDLPGDIGLCQSPKNKSNSDIASLGWVACGLLSGDFEKPQISGSESADKFFEIASNASPSVTQILSAVGVNLEDESTDSLVPGATPVDPTIPSLPSSEDSLSADPIPEVVEPTPEVVASSIEAPKSEVLETPAIPNVGADSLESIEQKQDDMFGDFDNVEVVSEMQAPQSFGSIAPVVVDNAYPAQQTGSVSPASKKQKQAEAEPATGKNNTVLLASIGGGVGVIVVGLLIFFLTRGGDDKKSEVASNNTSNQTDGSKSKDSKGKGDEDADKKSPDDDEANGMKKKELKSSGMFKNVGAFNSNKSNGGLLSGGPQKNGGVTTSTPKKNDPKKVNGGKAKGTQPVNSSPKNGQAKNNASNTGLIPSNPQPNNGKTAPKDSKADAKAKNPAKENTKADKSKTDVAEKGPGKKGDTIPAKGDDKAGAGDKKGKSETPVLLLGGNNKKDEKKNGEQNTGPKKLANPFVKSPNFVNLKLPKKGAGDLTAKQPLFPLALPPSLPLTITLHGGDKASKANIEFELKASTSENATWNIVAGSKSSKKPIAKFTYDGKDFCFSWNIEAGAFSNSSYLINCALRIQASQFRHEVALRTPAVSSMLEFAKNFSPNSDAKLDNLPNMENVKTVLVNIPQGFAKFDYPKGKDFLLGRSDGIRLFFRQKNIDVVQGQLSCKLRGSKMVVNMDLKYVTPDKKLENMTSFDKFEKIANQIITEANNLQIEYNALMKQHAALPTPEAKGAFTKLHGLTKMREQNTLAKRYKGHMEDTLLTVKAIQSKKVGVRIYYQAGEIEVDLATPDGKKYTKPAPAPKPAAKKGAKKSP